MILKTKYLFSTLAFVVLLLPLAGFRTATSATDATGVKWSSSRKLTWKDFTGPPNIESEMRAETYSRIHYTYTCRGSVMQAEVVAEFVPEKSWVKSNPSTDLLRHEQGHFDITELYARKLRQHFETLEYGCDKGRSFVDAEAQKFFQAWDNAQEKYDSETRHGRDDEMQEVWLKWISKELDALEEYSAE